MIQSFHMHYMIQIFLAHRIIQNFRAHCMIQSFHIEKFRASSSYDSELPRFAI